MSRPEELVLSTLKAVLDLFLDENYEQTIIKCSFLLRKKTNLDPSLSTSVQTILLQCYLEQEEYEKVIAWVDQNNKLTELGTYAKYRMKDYEAVSKQASKNATVLERHLLAQSYFRLNQTNPALKAYKELLNESQSDEAKMEVMHNAIAVIAANAAVPFVTLSEDSHQKWVDQAEEFLQEHPDNHHDLAFNLGTLQCLAGDNAEMDWLEEAETNCNDDEDIPAIEHNIAWSHHFWQKEGSPEVDYSEIEADPTSLPSILAAINKSLLDDKGKLPAQPNPKWNTLQIRMYWYNRAITQYKDNQLVEAQESCQSLKKTLSSQEQTKKKKAAANNTKHSVGDLWWEARVDVVMAYAQDAQSKTSAAIERLESRLESLKQQTPQSYTIDHAIAYVSLHLFSIQNASRRPSAAEIVAVLKALPESMQSHQAVMATIDALDDGSSKVQKTPLEQADMYFSQGKHEEAAKLYKSNLGNVEKCEDDELAYHLRYVQVLAMIGKHEESTQLWSKIQQGMADSFESSSRLDGEALEKQNLPRSSTTKSIDKQLGAGGLDDGKPKRSQKSILRQRAKRREAYLKELEAKGEYNPDRPVKPNPERWIPKHARSSNRRGRRGGDRGANRSAQGGGSAADAQRLDAAARRAGIVPAGAGPSTANMKVSDGSRKTRRR